MSGQIFYHAPSARTGDVIPKYIDGKYQLFYLKNWKEPEPADAVHGWHRMESTDLLHMSGETPIHVLGGTGDLILHDGQWHLFACIFPENRQYVNAQAALSFRMYDYKARRLGLFSFGRAAFRNLELKKMNLEHADVRQKGEYI